MRIDQVLTSGAVAEEHQNVSSENTMDELADAMTGGKDTGLWLQWRSQPKNLRGAKCFILGK